MSVFLSINLVYNPRLHGYKVPDKSMGNNILLFQSLVVHTNYLTDHEYSEQLEGSVTHAVRNIFQSIAVAGCDGTSHFL